MDEREFSCPNCGAPLVVDDSGRSTMICPYCETSVIVPKNLRATRPPEARAVEVTFTTPQTNPRAGKGTAAFIAIFAVVMVLIIGAATILPIMAAKKAADSASQIFSSIATIPAALTATPEPSDTPVPSPTPAFANPVLTFGEKGIGRGMFNDSRYITVDGAGTVYAADYQGGRVQAFDPQGKYLNQWKVGEEKTIFYGLTANQKGEVFVSYDNKIDRYDGKTGQLLGSMTSPNGGEFGDLFATADGGLAAAWYEGRWGLITSLEGHREDLVLFDPGSKIKSEYKSFISAQTEDVALDIVLAVDGLGNIYAMDQGTVYKFSPAGKYINRFTISDDKGQTVSANSMTVDGKGRLYFGGSRVVYVYSSEGKYLTYFPSPIYPSAMAFAPDGSLWMIGNDQAAKFELKK